MHGNMRRGKLPICAETIGPKENKSSTIDDMERRY